MFARLCSALVACRRAVGRFCACVRVSPFAFVLAVAATLFILSLILIFNVCLAKLFTIPGAFVLNLGICWLLLRLVVRALVFPGSIVLWKRNTEASYRVEMAKQFAHHIEHLLAFLQQATSRTPGAITNVQGVTMEGVMLGCTVVESLVRNFRLQQRDQVKFTAEQARVKLLLQGIDSWLSEAKVRERGGNGHGEDEALPLVDWMQKLSKSHVPVPLGCALASTELVSRTEVGPCVDRLEQLLGIFDALQCPKDNCCVNARRFMRVPTVGSLHQLRAELHVRYNAQHQWVRTPGGRKIDGMFISCEGSVDGSVAEENEGRGDVASKEETPLKDDAETPAFSGPTMIWCNPNAGYYETMVYESHWLDLYLRQGCNVFLFNYSGFGRSSGHPTPSALAADGDAIVEFLKKRGVTQIGIHGRSIGGICACYVAHRHPDVIKVLVADRTFSSLGRVAKFTFGNWAVKGLSLSATWAENFQKFEKARCHKILICDPKDATIPDLAALRTAAAMEALNRVPPSDSFTPEDERLEKLSEAWTFFEVLFGIYDRDEIPPDGSGHCAKHEAKRTARELKLGNPSSGDNLASAEAEEDMQHLVGSSSSSSAHSRKDFRDGPINTQWLEEHMEFVRSTMTPHLDMIRAALDAAGSQINAGGTTLDEAFANARAYDEPLYAMRCFLANLQVWGSIGSLREPLCPAIDRDIEMFLMHQRRLEHSDAHPELAIRLSLIAASLTPERLSTYHRQISRALVAQVRRDFRGRLSNIRRLLEPSTRDDSQQASRLFAAVLAHLREVESFLSSIYRFFKCVDLASEDAGLAEAGFGGLPTSARSDGLDSGEEGADPPPRPPRPNFDRTLTGYGVWVDCGHNGVLSEGEVQNFSLHLKGAGFGSGPDGPDNREGRRARGVV